MEIKDYKYIVVGAGIFGSTVAERLADRGKKVLVIDRRHHLGGNIHSYTDKKTGIEIHTYGSHIFHTESDEVWDYITKFTEFNDYIHCVDTRHNGKLYPMPINLDTINALYKTHLRADEAKEMVASEAAKDSKRLGIKDPKNFEEKAITLVGEKLYSAFLKNYTKKQWHTDPKNLDAAILSRIPVRYSHDNRYFINAKHQGIPKQGYTKMIENMLSNENITVKFPITFKEIETEISPECTIIYCGTVDELMDYQLGVLPYRSLRFEKIRTKESLGQAVVNEADFATPYTRTHDYKYYQIHQPEVINHKTSIQCREYPADFEKGGEAYYPVNNDESEKLYKAYLELIKEKYPNLLVGGRLGNYRYWDMDVAVQRALWMAEEL